MGRECDVDAHFVVREAACYLKLTFIWNIFVHQVWQYTVRGIYSDPMLTLISKSGLCASAQPARTDHQSSPPLCSPAKLAGSSSVRQQPVRIGCMPQADPASDSPPRQPCQGMWRRRASARWRTPPLLPSPAASPFREPVPGTRQKIN